MTKSPLLSKKKSARILATAKLPTHFGNFIIVAFTNNIDNKEHVALVKGAVAGKTNVPLRMHSECLTGEVFHSLRCDCLAQLEAALKKISKLPRGVLIYLRQEGRGIGLSNKIRAYELQDKGMDTVQANRALGFPSDMRDYKVAAEMIKQLGIKSIALITNNPEKISNLKSHGINVTKRIPHEFGKTKHNKAYLLVKKNKMGHLLTEV